VCVAVCVAVTTREQCSAEYSRLHLECHLISFSNLNLIGLFSTERGKRDVEN